MNLVMGWQAYMRFYAYLVALAQVHDFTFETVAVHRNLLEFRLIEAKDDFKELLQNYVWTHLQ
jgi:hypothetical protein